MTRLRLYCLHCRQPLSLIAEERLQRDGRILCLVCRKAEVRMPTVSWWERAMRWLMSTPEDTSLI